MSQHAHSLPGWISDSVGVVLAVGAGLTAQPWVVALTCASLAAGTLYHLVVAGCHVAKAWRDWHDPRPPRPWPGLTFDQIEGRGRN